MTNHIHLIAVPERDNSLARALGCTHSEYAHAREHVQGPVLDCRWEEYFGRWDYGEGQEILSAGISGGECDSLRHAIHTGEPLGSQEFVTALERQAGRTGCGFWPAAGPKTSPKLRTKPAARLFAGCG